MDMNIQGDLRDVNPNPGAKQEVDKKGITYYELDKKVKDAASKEGSDAYPMGFFIEPTGIIAMFKISKNIKKVATSVEKMGFKVQVRLGDRIYVHEDFNVTKNLSVRFKALNVNPYKFMTVRDCYFIQCANKKGFSPTLSNLQKIYEGSTAYTMRIRARKLHEMLRKELKESYDLPEKAMLVKAKGSRKRAILERVLEKHHVIQEMRKMLDTGPFYRSCLSLMAGRTSSLRYVRTSVMEMMEKAYTIEGIQDSTQFSLGGKMIEAMSIIGIMENLSIRGKLTPGKMLRMGREILEVMKEVVGQVDSVGGPKTISQNFETLSKVARVIFPERADMADILTKISAKAVLGEKLDSHEIDMVTDVLASLDSELTESDSTDAVKRFGFPANKLQVMLNWFESFREVW
jgi:hypothetical protein